MKWTAQELLVYPWSCAAVSTVRVRTLSWSALSPTLAPSPPNQSALGPCGFVCSATSRRGAGARASVNAVLCCGDTCEGHRVVACARLALPGTASPHIGHFLILHQSADGHVVVSTLGLL